MKKLILLTCISLLALNSSAKEFTPKRTVVAGKVINRVPEDPEIISTLFCDPINPGSDIKAVKLNAAGEFHTEYDMYLSQNITVKYNDYYINLFLNPSDSVYMEIDMSKFRDMNLDGITFSGDGAAVNNQLDKFVNYLYSIESEEIDTDLPPKEFMAKVKEVISNLDDSIAVYSKRNDLLPAVVDWGKRDAVYTTANYSVLEYAADNGAYQSEVFTDPVFDLYNDDNFKTMLFPYHVEATMSVILNADEKFRGYVKSGDNKQAALYGIEVLTKLPASFSREYMIFTLINMLSEEAPDLYASLPQDLFTYDVFKDKFGKKGDQVVEFKETPLKGISYLNADNTVTALPEQDFFTYITDRHKGKVIYIDVWATWCGPCKAEIPHAKKLHDLHKDVVFVNLCINSNMNAWQSTVKELEAEGENYFFGLDSGDLFRGTYKIDGLPQYILLGKDGKISDLDAPRPSKIEKTSQAINALK